MVSLPRRTDPSRRDPGDRSAWGRPSLIRDMHLAYVCLSFSAGSTHEAALAQIKAVEGDAEEYQRERRSLKG